MASDGSVIDGSAIDGSAGSGDFVAISTHDDTNCALRRDGRAVCWGYAFPDGIVRESVDEVVAGRNQACFRRGSQVECVPASFAASSSLHPLVPPGEYISVGTGTRVSCAIRSSGAPECWGWDETVQGAEIAPPRTGSMASISVSADTACALLADGGATCWLPSPSGGRLSDLPDGSYSFARAGWGARCGIEAVSSEILCTSETCVLWCGDHVCAPTETGGTERCEDYLGTDEIGRAIRWSERVGPGPGGRFVQIAMPTLALFVCGLREDGSIECWGEDAARLGPPSRGPFTAIAAGLEHACAIDAAADIACWGNPTNDWGQARPPPDL